MLKPQVFISYSHKSEPSRNFIDTFKRIVKMSNDNTDVNKQRFDIWTDDDIEPGSEWQEIIDNAIDESFALLVLITPEAVGSHYVTYEWSRALGLKRIVIPIIIAKVDDLHGKLERIQWKNLTGRSWPLMIDEIVEKLEDNYKKIRIHEKFQESQRVAQLIYSALSYSRRQREIGDLKNAMQSLQGAEKSIEEFERINGRISATVEPDSALIGVTDDVYYELGQIYFLLNKYQEAEEYFRKALTYNSDHVYSHISLGVLARKKGDAVFRTPTAKQHWEDARKCFEKALELQDSILDHEGQSLWASLGGIYKRQGSPENAIKHYEKAIENKKSSYPYNNLGLLYFQLEKIEDVVANFRVSLFFAKAQLGIKPDDHWAHSDQLIAQIVLNKSGHDDEKIDPDKMERLIDHVIRVSPVGVLNRLKSVLEEITKRNSKYKQSKKFKENVIDMVAAESAMRKIQDTLKNF